MAKNDGNGKDTPTIDDLQKTIDQLETEMKAVQEENVALQAEIAALKAASAETLTGKMLMHPYGFQDEETGSIRHWPAKTLLSDEDAEILESRGVELHEYKGSK